MTRRAALRLMAATPAIGDAPLLAASAPRKRRAFKRSDVVFGFPFTPAEYEMWHGSVLYGWTRGPRNKEEIPTYIERKNQALSVGVRSGVAINAFAIPYDWFRSRDPQWRDRIWRNYSGELIAEPWVRPPNPFPPEQGRICTNHPLYLDLKKEQVDLGMAVEPAAFHIDDPLGTATELFRQGCFCSICIAGFREYLARHVSPERLSALGIDDLSAFDYAAFLRQHSDRPLWYEFENYQLRNSVENVRRIIAYAREKRGAPLDIGSNAPLAGAHIVFAPLLDYVCAEVGTDAREKKFGAKPMLNYKMGEALGIAVAATGIYQDWVMLYEHDIPDLVRGWVAESYAMGGNFIVPHKEWGFIQPPGKLPQPIGYPAKVELIGPLYEFVHRYPELFDDYEAVTQAGLLYDYQATRQTGRGHEMPQTPVAKPTPIHEVCLALARAQIQFGMAVAGGEPFDYTLQAGDLERFPLLVINEPLMVEGPQRKLIDAWERQGRVVRWRGIESVLARIQPQATSSAGGTRVWLFPRVNNTAPRAPLVCHVLNRDFDAAAERLTPQRDLVVRIGKASFGQRPYAHCRCFAPSRSPQDLKIRRVGKSVEVSIPLLDAWAVLHFA